MPHGPEGVIHLHHVVLRGHKVGTKWSLDVITPAFYGPEKIITTAPNGPEVSYQLEYVVPNGSYRGHLMVLG